MRSLLAIPILALLWAPLAGQAVWVVDADGRPGSDFTDLPTAVAAAIPGDTLLVRTASVPYAAFTTDKGLRILGAGDTAIVSYRFNPAVTVTSLPAWQSFTMDGFVVPTEQAFEMVLQNCAGRVVLSRLKAAEPCSCGPGVLLPAGIAITDCAQVSIDDCENFGKPAISCVRSNVVITRCKLGITSAGIGIGDCLLVHDSVVDVVESELDGRMAMDIMGRAQPAVVLTAGTLRLGATEQTFVQGSTITGPGSYQPAIDASGGTLVLDPDVRLNPQAGGGIGLDLHGAQLELRQTAFAVVHRGSIGGTLDAELFAAPLAPSLLLLGLPIAPLPVAPFGTLWLDPSASIPLAFGVPISGSLVGSLTIPAGLPQGLNVCIQGAADLGAGLELSSAALVVLR